MERKVSKDVYIIAGIITILVFSLGVTLGVILDNARLKSVQFENRVQETDYKSLQFMYFLLSNYEDNGKNCDVLNTALDKTISELGESMDEMLEYRKESRTNTAEYDITVRRYVIDNIRYWFFANQAKEECNRELVSVLYFYSGEYCAECPDQGVILTYFKKIYEESLLIFPIDVDMEEMEPLVSILVTKFNISSFPTLIIGDDKFEGVIGKEELKKLICDGFEDKTFCIG